MLCDILVVVHSALDHFKDRLAIRNTYGKYASKEPKHYHILFLLGRKTRRDSIEVENAREFKLKEEQEAHGDILQVKYWANKTRMNCSVLHFETGIQALTLFQS